MSQHKSIVQLKLGSALIVALSIVLIARFMYLQIWDHDDLFSQAENNRTILLPITPTRGKILDRHGETLATNQIYFQIVLHPHKLSKGLKEVLLSLKPLLDLDAEKLYSKLSKKWSYKTPIILKKPLSDEELAKFLSQQYRFPELELSTYTERYYPFKDSASHVLGYVGAISKQEYKHLEAKGKHGNYRGTSAIGKTGIEQYYEEQLHGTTGLQTLEVTASSKITQLVEDNPAVPGVTLRLSLDIKLQQLIEKLLETKKGAVVVLNAQSGEILAMVSKPNYDLNLFNNGIRKTDWEELLHNENKPLLHRALNGVYPPGSTYKPFMALAALELGVRKPEDNLVDPGYFQLGEHIFLDDKPGGHGVVNMYKAIVESCNTYFYKLAFDMTIDRIYNKLYEFGFGQTTGIDLRHEAKGILPSVAWKQNQAQYQSNPQWSLGDTISVGIGQGFNSFSPLQLAVGAAFIANGGYKVTPRLLSSQNLVSGTTLFQPNRTKLPIQTKNLEFITQAMQGVNQTGTARKAFSGSSYFSAGKTGTAQVFSLNQGETYNTKTLSKKLHDHALYIGFAQQNYQQYAISVVVENAGFGAESAAPIARQVFDYLMK
ncbi:MAG: penicillin-binding protein 2, partial [Gammaproteobacteria bacterium]|nr:penicillin-binding protein 2 [Gammaproteobacteria bacterium]